MMWEELMIRVLDDIVHDPTLMRLYGGNIRKAHGTGEIEAPLLEYTIISDTETELWNPIVVQFDQWHTVADDVRHSEQRLRAMFRDALPIVLDGVQFFSMYVDGEILADQNRDGFSGQATRFKFTPLRSDFALREASLQS